MTCFVCKGHWCWDCGEQYLPGLPGHWETCPQTLIPIHIRALHRLREKFRRIMPKCLFFLFSLFTLAVSTFIIFGNIHARII